MSYDPASVKALLEQLRESQEWKDMTAASRIAEESVSAASTSPDVDTATSNTSSSKDGSPTSASVASLLSQLQNSSSWATVSTLNSNITPASSTIKNSSRKQTLASPTSVVPIPTLTPAAEEQDPRTFTFQQALPRIAQLANDEEFVAAIKQMKKEQDDLERQLGEDRQSIYRKYEEKVKVATTKAGVLGDSGLSKHEAEMLQSGLKRELDNFDRERILVAWDGLISKQQTMLANLSVPTMFRTTEGTDRERQQRVMQVLEGIAHP